MKNIVLVLISVCMFACASQRPKDATNYENDLAYPKEAFPYIFTKKHVYDDPLGGISLTYIDQNNPSDFITIYVYPVPAVDWDDKQLTLNSEMDAVLMEVDYMVQLGRYESRTSDRRNFIKIPDSSREAEGLESVFKYVYKGVEYNSFGYLFIEEDKLIKFRASFVADESPSWDGRHIVQTLLPAIDAPPESDYMKKLRAEFKQK